MDERALNIYTDGSSRPTPRRGGVGIVYVFVNELGNEVKEELEFPGYQGATNNEMELHACVLGLEHASNVLKRYPFDKLIIHTDSAYVVDNHLNAMFTWPRTKWRTRSGAPVLNAELWKSLVKSIRDSGRRIEFKKVKGHSPDLFNRAANRLARESALIPLNRPLVPSTVRRKRSKHRTEVGGVEMLGQRLTIRIIDCRRLSVQKLYRYRYEVLSRGSPFVGCVDFAFSILVLREGHTFHVRMNSDTGNPQIMIVYREVLPKPKAPDPEHT